MVQRGVLGELKYSDSAHGWVTYVGDCLARLQILSSAIENGRPPPSRRVGGSKYPIERSPPKELDHVMDILRQNLEQHGIPFRPGKQLLSKSWQTFDKVLEEVQRKYSPSYKAFALISSAHTYLQFFTPGINGELYEVAENVLSKINIDCDLINTRTLFDVLRRAENLAKSSREVLIEFQAHLTILLVLADPRSEERLRLLEEKRVLEETLQFTSFRDSFIVKDQPSCRLGDLGPSLLRHKPRIIHFSGHGSDYGLVFEDVAGDAQTTDLQSLADVLALARQDGLEAVILNACDSATQAQLIANAVGRAIAMTGPILDEAAIEFTRSFYGALGEGRSFDFAFEWGVKQVALNVGPGTAEPKLFFQC